jgi:hypothetical protein
MAETTKPTSATQNASTSASGGTRNATSPPSTPASSSTASPTGGSSQAQRSQVQQPQSGGDAMRDAKKVGSELVGAARDSAASLIETQRARAAEQITAVGDALRRSMESFETSGSSALAEYANQAADQICGFADAVRDRSWSDLANDLESFARRSPMLFMASAVGIGFLAGRFLLSSSNPTHTVGGSSTGTSGVRAGEPRREAGGVGRAAPSGARAEYGSSGIRE